MGQETLLALIGIGGTILVGILSRFFEFRSLKINNEHNQKLELAKLRHDFSMTVFKRKLEAAEQATLSFSKISNLYDSNLTIFSTFDPDYSSEALQSWEAQNVFFFPIIEDLTKDITGWLNTSDLYFELGEIAVEFDRVMREIFPRNIALGETSEKLFNIEGDDNDSQISELSNQLKDNMNELIPFYKEVKTICGLAIERLKKEIRSYENIQ